MFTRGEWAKLVEMSLETSMDAAKKNSRARPRDQDTIEKRARRALRMVHLGEVSAGRQALEGAPLAKGDNTTLSQLRDQSRRPALPREMLPEDLACFVPEQEFVLEEGWFSHLRKARRGAAPGPSGMTSDHLLPLLEVSADSLALGQVASLFSRAQVPLEIVEALGAGRMTALKKPDGGVRGIVVVEIFRRVTAQTIAQQSTPKRWKSLPLYISMP